MENCETVSTIVGSKAPITKPAKIAIHHTINSSEVKQLPKCKCCDGFHSLFKCQQYKSMGIPMRREFVLKHNLCFNCLVGNSAQSYRSHFLCHYCRGKHHSSLHLSVSNVSSKESTHPIIPTSTATQSMPSTSTTTHSLCIQSQPANSSGNQTTQEQPRILELQTNFNQQSPEINETTQLKMVHTTEHLLPTAVVNIANVHGALQQCRILLDSGSMGNLISQSLVKKLQLTQRKSNTIVSGIASNTTSQWATTAKISSHFNPQQEVTFDAHILASLSSVPIQSFTKPHIPQSNSLQLADPNFNERSPVDIILNAGIVFSTLLP